ncbi:EVE domain-containing protein [Prochlorococcus marinus]|uniref:EVE domain-containing protein n=1 Tax=Prochlorococcus marinus TaxID=1219 RepID=UPI0022B580B9|nr:EVE domain-containing protein [Prochlorococcus marinus]
MSVKEINYWLMKSEPDAYSIKDLKNEVETLWDGIRNYQARNFMRSMKIGDRAFFYHSNTKPPGIVGLMEIIETKLVDPYQFDESSKYYDKKSLIDNPRWDCVKTKYVSEFKNMITLKELSETYTSEELTLVRKGNRLSIMPIKKDIALELLKKLEKN